jgi:hypothetical protein
LRSNIKGYGGKTHQTDSQNSDTTAPSGRELYHLQISLQAASPETFRYTLVHVSRIGLSVIFEAAVNLKKYGISLDESPISRTGDINIITVTSPPSGAFQLVIVLCMSVCMYEFIYVFITTVLYEQQTTLTREVSGLIGASYQFSRMKFFVFLSRSLG